MPGLIALAAVGDAADQPAAADRHDQHVEVGHRGEHFERDRPRARDDRGVVERMDEHQPALGLELLGVGVGVVEPFAVEDDASRHGPRSG